MTHTLYPCRGRFVCVWSWWANVAHFSSMKGWIDYQNHSGTRGRTHTKQHISVPTVEAVYSFLNIKALFMNHFTVNTVIMPIYRDLHPGQLAGWPNPPPPPAYSFSHTGLFTCGRPTFTADSLSSEGNSKSSKTMLGYATDCYEDESFLCGGRLYLFELE